MPSPNQNKGSAVANGTSLRLSSTESVDGKSNDSRPCGEASPNITSAKALALLP